MISLKSTREIQGMQAAGDILAGLFHALSDYIKPGITTWDIDHFSYQYIVDHDATPGELNFEGYKYSTCVSVNDVICHGCPSKDVLIKRGDLIKVDTVIDYHGYLSDACHAFVAGQPSAEVQKLMDVTRKALYLGIDQAVVGNRIGDIGFAIQDYAETQLGYGVVRDYIGHGIGPTMHEDPDVPHYGTAGHGTRLKAGMTITIEPMINVGSWECSAPAEDGWTISTVDGSLSCQYEHTLVVTADGPKILTSFDHERDAQYLLK
ncbi:MULTISPECIES: type I methionyl aminopeptidase [Lactobacillaceae]|uniref:type I methionyl aminopeptidase n=1 Tax=Lactobacillaceae TaxID=33958 RepID=UPI0014568A5E|nr:type I methionyl aminopeptidase [Lactobacillus sp. HBUAS51381]NLR09419.1 type I methionyl aminopeptidase [Lactobacillus sp. HBUAS51381]